MGKMLEKLKQVEEKKTGEAKVSPFGMMLKTAVNKAAKSAKGSGRVSMNDDDAAFFLFENMELASVKYWVKTGFVGLDWILSSGRGFPMGRAVEIWGMEATAKSALAQYIAARFQHKYSQGHVVYADAENSLDADHLKGYGIDPYRFIPLYPVHLEAGMDSLSSALECCTKPKKSKDPKPDPVMFIMDSVAQFPPRAEVVEDNSTDSHVGLQARIMSKGCRKLVRPLAERKMGVIFLNQVRTKIGVMYGCFHRLSRVLFADGTTECIGTIVNKKLTGPVLCVDEATGEVVSRSITAWHKNGPTKDWVHVQFDGWHNGRGGFRATLGHEVYTPDGRVVVGSLKKNEVILMPSMEYFSPDQHEIILGSIFGDGSLRWEAKTRGTLRMMHGPNQREYCAWKAQALGSSLNGGNRPEFSTASSEEFQQYRGIIKCKGLLHVPQAFIDRLTPRVAAIWYMDDGTYYGSHLYWGYGKVVLYATLLCERDLRAFAHKFATLGMGRPTYKKGHGFTWSGEQSMHFQRSICQYVHPSMRYKLHQAAPKPFEWNPVRRCPETVLVPVRVSSVVIERAVGSPSNREKFDITVEGTHNYFVGGALVHNSPESRPCGHALDFACSVILKTTRFKTLTRTKGGEKVRWGYLIQVKSTKSRLAPPHRETEIVVSFKKGPDPVETALHLAKKAHLIKPAGSEGFKWPGIVTGSFKPSKFSEIWAKEKDKINEAILAALESGATLSDDSCDSDDGE